MRNRFDQQLDILSSMLIHMGELCTTAIEEVVVALNTKDRERAKAVIAADSEIDQMEKDIEGLCLKLLLQQQPVARDLRQISAALKMITDMERIGDQTGDIADIVLSTEIPASQSYTDIETMAVAVAKMVGDSITAYVQKDLAMARGVMEADEEVDRLFDIIKKELIDVIAQEHDEKSNVAIDLIMITKYLERIGDHATNIAEWVEFSITGIHAGSMV